MITLYGSMTSRATRNLWVLEELGLTYEFKKVNLSDGSHKKPEFMAINPAAKIPALTDDGGVCMSESFAINLYLAQRYGAGKLWPADPAQQAACLQWSMWAATEVEMPIVAVVVEKVFKPADKSDAATIERNIARFTPEVKYIDSVLAGKDYLVGNSFTIADLNAAVILNSLNRIGFDLSPYPNLARWLKACTSRPANQKVQAMPR
ncbi:MAG: glutathione S-transferase family protein [Rhodospirillaceae bacterium]|nr:glutathione S-transferase family protein [Rhodospirillaceae bacterium]